MSVYIESARFISCQSLQDCTLYFSPGLNVIKAEGASNQTGKSVLFKMIEALVSNKSYARSEWKDLISGKKKQAVFMVQFSDKTVGIVNVTPKGPVYFYSSEMVDGKPVYIKSDNPFNEVRDKLGVIVDDTDGTILNIINQKNINRFTDTTSTSPSIVKKITTHEETESLLVGLSLSLERAQESLNYLEADLYRSQVVMENSRYVNVEEIEPVLEIVEESIKVYEVIVEIERSLGYFAQQDTKEIPYKLYAECCQALITILELEEMMKTLDSVEERETYLEDLKHVLNSLVGVTDTFPMTEKETEINKDVEKVLGIFGTLMEVNPVELVDYTSYIEKARAVEMVVDIIEDLENVSSKADDNLKVKTEIERLNTDIRLLGREVECPIYGKIQHDNGICVPLSY